MGPQPRNEGASKGGESKPEQHLPRNPQRERSPAGTVVWPRDPVWTFVLQGCKGTGCCFSALSVWRCVTVAMGDGCLRPGALWSMSDSGVFIVPESGPSGIRFCPRLAKAGPFGHTQDLTAITFHLCNVCGDNCGKTV